MLEALILDINNQPIVKSHPVTQLNSIKTLLASKKLSFIVHPPELTIRTPKPIEMAALCTYAVSVAFKSSGSFVLFPGTNQVLVMEGTAVAIDPHHLLTTAHSLEWNTAMLGEPPQDIQYLYSSFHYMLI